MKRIFILIIIVILTYEVKGQVFGNMIEGNIQSTVLINTGSVSGSGFLVKDSLQRISLITAKHVIFDANKNFSVLNSNEAVIQFYAKNFKSDSANYIIIDLTKLQCDNFICFDPIHDICIILIAKLDKGAIQYNNGIFRYGHNVKYDQYPFNEKTILKKDELFIGEDVFVVGFPRAIGLKQIPQFDYSKPLLKRGAIASISDNLGNIIIDCPVYGGNSGGPVFLERKSFDKYSLRFIGIVSQFIPFINPTASNKDMTIQISSYAVIIPIEYAFNLIYKK